MASARTFSSTRSTWRVRRFAVRRPAPVTQRGLRRRRPRVQEATYGRRCTTVIMREPDRPLTVSPVMPRRHGELGKRYWKCARTAPTVRARADSSQPRALAGSVRSHDCICRDKQAAAAALSAVLIATRDSRSHSAAARSVTTAPAVT